MKLVEALAEMHDHYRSAGWPSDWYSMEMDLGWLFVSPSRPGMIVVVANNRRVDDLRSTDPEGATDAAVKLLRKLQQ
jgi:hypothetical protein